MTDNDDSFFQVTEKWIKTFLETLKFFNAFHDFQPYQQFLPTYFEIKFQFRQASLTKSSPSVLLTSSLCLHTRRCPALPQMANIYSRSHKTNGHSEHWFSSSKLQTEIKKKIYSEHFTSQFANVLNRLFDKKRRNSNSSLSCIEISKSYQKTVVHSELPKNAQIQTMQSSAQDDFHSKGFQIKH